MTNDQELAQKIDKAVFPGMQGGPLMHVIAAKAVAFAEGPAAGVQDVCTADRQNAQSLAAALKSLGYRIVSGGTDNHLMLSISVPATKTSPAPKPAIALEKAGVIVNFNGIPKDPRPAKLTSGVRLGTPALTTPD